MQEDIEGVGTWTYSNAIFGGTGSTTAATEEHSKNDKTSDLYGQYNVGNLTLDTEYRRYWRDEIILSGMAEVTTDIRGWFASGSYRLSKRFSFGAYYSRFTDVSGDPPAAIDTNTSGSDHHLYDKVVSLRYDLRNNWFVKVEEHFMDGYGSPGMYPDGFYTMDNPQGLKPKTDALIIRTGVYF
jgi:hypothetical protein